MVRHQWRATPPENKWSSCWGKSGVAVMIQIRNLRQWLILSDTPTLSAFPQRLAAISLSSITDSQCEPLHSFPLIILGLKSLFSLPNSTTLSLGMLASLPVALVLLLSTSSDVLAAPKPGQTAGQSITMFKRSPRRTAEEMAQWAKSHREMLITKYGGKLKQKRSSGTNLWAIVNCPACGTSYEDFCPAYRTRMLIQGVLLCPAFGC